MPSTPLHRGASFTTLAASAALAGGVALWAGVVLAPLLALAGRAAQPAPPTGNLLLGPALANSCLIAAGIAACAVLLGLLPGRLMAWAIPHGRSWLLALCLCPLLLPSYVLQYAWMLPLSPGAPWGAYLAQQPELARAVATGATLAVLALWHWPVAALVLAQGWNRLGQGVVEQARLDAPRLRRIACVYLPLLAPAGLLAFALCFVLALAEFTTFHLAGLWTIGTELAILHEQTGSAAAVARAAWPTTLPALAVAALLWRTTLADHDSPAYAPPALSLPGLHWTALGALLLLSPAIPIAIMLCTLHDAGPLRQFILLHSDELAWSSLCSALAAVAALLLAWSAVCLRCDGYPRPLQRLGAFIELTLLATLLAPPSVLGAALLQFLSDLTPLAPLRQSWMIVTAGLTLRYGGLAVIVLHCARRSEDRGVLEQADIDGATAAQTWLHIRLPMNWPLLAGAALTMTLLGLTEVPATMMLLPPGLPSFPQRLLNQMHYARDQQVIASCLVLTATYLLLAPGLCRLLARRLGGVGALVLALALLPGCQRPPAEPRPPEVLGLIGKTGGGPGELLYPRGVDRAADGTLVVVDKTGRIQRLSPQGQCLGVWQLPDIAAGKPTGMTLDAHGRLWVADTHYHRVLVYDAQGNIVRRFGTFGQGPGQFIYPTDIAFLPDGRVLVSEYGGNDRVSVFDAEGTFLTSFGTLGSGWGEFSRPACLAVDATRGRLYVADACNHRIAVYDLSLNLLGYWGQAGTGGGQLRYPYGLAVAQDGRVIVCEFGNNRVQVFGPDGDARRVYGSPGREAGQLAYPWGVATDGREQVFIVDAGNNRLQVWRL